MNPFDVLGVPESANDDAISAAHRSLARRFHPDAHPGASPAQREDYEAAMVRINVAYEAIKTDDRRTAYFRQDAGLEDVASQLRTPGRGECDLCGSTPASRFGFEYQVAWVFGGQRSTLESELCRQCALATGRDQQNRTLYSGWWGISALFTNFGVVWRNATQLKAARRLAAPHPQPDVVAPLSIPIPDTKGLFRRGGVWFAILVLTGASVATVVYSANESESRRTSATAETSWDVGNCVDGDRYVHALPCSEPHIGKIIAERAAEDFCPDQSDSSVSPGSRVYCIDENQ